MSRIARVAPSILAGDFAALGAEARAMAEAGADMLHVDVMDGHFVPNLTIGPPVVKALAEASPLALDVHLMIAPVDPFIAAFKDAGAAILTVHPEAGPHLHRTLQAIRGAGMQAGVALNPATPPDVLDHVLELVDLVLVMTVNPGFGGQTFIDAQLPKIRAVRGKLDAIERPITLEVDGGVNPATARLCREAGATMLVAGTAAFEGGPERYRANIRALKGLV